MANSYQKMAAQMPKNSTAQTEVSETLDSVKPSSVPKQLNMASIVKESLPPQKGAPTLVPILKK